MTQEVVFICRRRLWRAGSKIMRCDQLAEIGRRNLGERYRFSVRALPRMVTDDARRDFAESLAGRIVVLLKGTGAMLGENGMQMLRAASRGLAIDYVDGHAGECFSPHADLHIAASHAGEAILRRVLARKGSVDGQAGVAHLTHHHDPRLEGMMPRRQDTLRAAYLGHARNVHIPGEISHRIQRIVIGRGGDMPAAFDRLCDFNLHYTIRPPGLAGTPDGDVAKPFTKGFVAAALGANVLVTRDTDDAELYLGRGYPFLVDDTAPATIATALDRAEGLYDTPGWHEASERMRYLREMSSPRHVARELDVILSRLQVRGGAARKDRPRS